MFGISIGMLLALVALVAFTIIAIFDRVKAVNTDGPVKGLFGSVDAILRTALLVAAVVGTYAVGDLLLF